MRTDTGPVGFGHQRKHTHLQQEDLHLIHFIFNNTSEKKQKPSGQNNRVTWYTVFPHSNLLYNFCFSSHVSSCSLLPLSTHPTTFQGSTFRIVLLYQYFYCPPQKKQKKNAFLFWSNKCISSNKAPRTWSTNGKNGASQALAFPILHLSSSSASSDQLRSLPVLTWAKRCTLDLTAAFAMTRPAPE